MMTESTRPRLGALWPFALIFLVGCFGHNYPGTNQFIEAPTQSVPTAHVFVDANGSFYPSGWDQYLRPRALWKAHSLLNESVDDPAFRATIEADEVRQLSALRDFTGDKQRVFIFVHGFNNNFATATRAFELLDEKLRLRPGDGVIRFYWDGLVANGVSRAKIWFNATGYSQLAGSRGLRRILNQIHNAEVYLIGHSRGASVILSALSNPIYDPEFVERTQEVAANWGPQYRDFLNPPELAHNDNSIHAMLMGPAIGRIDFCEQRDQPSDGRCRNLRSLGEQLKSFRYSVNPLDKTLNKYVKRAGYFNPTDMGVDRAVGDDLKATKYGFFSEPYVFDQGRTWHWWPGYIKHPTFDQMLSEAGLD